MRKRLEQRGVYPPGECYRNVIQYLKDRHAPSARIVHGTILSLGTGRQRRILHAWIEDGANVIDPTQGVTIELKRYYQLVSARVDARYTLEQAMVLALRTQHWGPWIGQGATRNPRVARHAAEAGFIYERTHPFVKGSLTVIYNAEEQGIGLMDDGGKYAVVCDAHSTIVQTNSKKDARIVARWPNNFCAECAKLYERSK